MKFSTAATVLALLSVAASTMAAPIENEAELIDIDAAAEENADLIPTWAAEGDGFIEPFAPDTNATLHEFTERATFTGQGTYFYPGLGACGKTNNNNQLIVAMGKGYFDGYPGATKNPNKNPICGRQLTAKYGGKSVTVKVEDRCAGCAGYYDLDFSPAAFQKLAPLSKGRLSGVKWTWS